MNQTIRAGELAAGITLNLDQAQAVVQRIKACAQVPHYRTPDVSIGFVSDGPCGPGLYCWPDAATVHIAALFATPLQHERDFAEDRLPARDQYGMVFHPDMDGIGDNESPMGPQLRAIGFRSQALSLEDDDTVEQSLKDAYFEKGEADFSFWNPHGPVGFKLAAMYDTEEGPVALYVQRVAR